MSIDIAAMETYVKIHIDRGHAKVYFNTFEAKELLDRLRAADNDVKCLQEGSKEIGKYVLHLEAELQKARETIEASKVPDAITLLQRVAASDSGYCCPSCGRGYGAAGDEVQRLTLENVSLRATIEASQKQEAVAEIEHTFADDDCNIWPINEDLISKLPDGTKLYALPIIPSQQIQEEPAFWIWQHTNGNIGNDLFSSQDAANKSWEGFSNGYARPVYYKEEAK